ncbi:hypothetical protein [Phaeodactylibacter sp.]|uniref:toxin-antitoxin system YwqK family antitoxin n=1 Tax=Phaeodactylibacter sp. TaxID=1940289 RepID=UPI0025E7F6C7|nr:hypothetical protein [Phaeodactylibacter sp.]MCI4649512.1 hypothetical protein [Phaeodactylibacter sp.]MCI5094351.1 hypothetical protein [Phaeodactylibacter sp.]
MKLPQAILAIILLANPVSLPGSCAGEYFSITELLNHDPQNHHIFTCAIIETYTRRHSFESIAVVKRRFRGSPVDTIFLNTGGGTTAGGQKLYPGEVWLVFSTTKDSLHYGATVCDFLSARIKAGNNQACSRSISPLGNTYLDVLEAYESVRENKFSGSKHITGDGRLVAKGHFLAGEPHGEWVHYSRRDYFEKEIKRSEIAYRKGALHGEYRIYREAEEDNFVSERKVYHGGRLLLKEMHEVKGQVRYAYNSDERRTMVAAFTDSLGQQRKHIAQVELWYDSEPPLYPIRFRHGYYLLKSGRDSSSYSPLAEGVYFRGMRVGKWTFFNKEGAIVATKTYPDIPADTSTLQIFDEEGQVRLSGTYTDGKRKGVWQYFYDGQLEHEEVYSSDGNLLSKTRFYRTGGFEYTPYANNLQHGWKTVFAQSGTIKSMEHYKHGRLSGTSIFFNTDGTLSRELRYVQSRAYTVSDPGNSTYLVNGFLNGPFVQHHYKTGEKLVEGTYWMGYRTGIWTEYATNGGYRKLYYPTGQQALMNRCGHAMPELTEQYDNEGNLLNSWKF